MLKMINPMANLLMNEAVIALVLSSNDIKNMGMMEKSPKTVPAISPFAMFVIRNLFWLYGCYFLALVPDIDTRR